LIPPDVATATVSAIRAGDLKELSRLLKENPGLETAELGGPYGSRTPLHIVVDWPGFFPNGPRIAEALLEAGADPNGHRQGQETPLHWAASNDDAHVAAVLIDGGADVNAPDGSIGTPIENAVGYGCWEVARLLVARGAKVERLWPAAALGMLTHLEELLIASTPSPEDLSQAFWHACSGGQRRAAEFLRERGADVNWIPEYAEGTPLDAASSLSTQRQNLVDWLKESGARSSAQAE
jgi:ankyrin repeat protein